jgi:hypothetical protein
MSWNDFNSADEQRDYDLIPKGTLARVRMTIRPGGMNDPAQGWTGGYATRGKSNDSVYLDCEFVILEGKYAKRKVWTLIGLYSPKGPDWGNQGRAFIKGILNSSRRLNPKDNSPEAQTRRRIAGFQELDGVEFAAKIDIENGDRGDKNVIRLAITPDHKEYAALMGGAGYTAPAAGYTPHAAAQQSLPTATPTNRPSWAQ